MTLSELFLPEFEREMAGTRRTLERIPDDRLDWKAHPRSNTIGWVGSHLAEIPGWVEGTLTQDSWDINPVGGEPYHTPLLISRRKILEAFDDGVAAGKRSIAATSDAAFEKQWSLLSEGQPIVTMPRFQIFCDFIINHTVHHRATLCVYLRLNDIPVPALYGPSADEQ